MRTRLAVGTLLLAALCSADQTVNCSVDGRAEHLSGTGGLAVNYLGCGHIICDRHTHWVEINGVPWWKLWARHMEPQCPIDGWVNVD